MVYALARVKRKSSSRVYLGERRFLGSQGTQSYNVYTADLRRPPFNRRNGDYKATCIVSLSGHTAVGSKFGRVIIVGSLLPGA